MGLYTPSDSAESTDLVEGPFRGKISAGRVGGRVEHPLLGAGVAMVFGWDFGGSF